MYRKHNKYIKVVTNSSNVQLPANNMEKLMLIMEKLL